MVLCFYIYIYIVMPRYRLMLGVGCDEDMFELKTGQCEHSVWTVLYLPSSCSHAHVHSTSAAVV